MGLDLEGRVVWPSSVHSRRVLNVFPMCCIFNSREGDHAQISKNLSPHSIFRFPLYPCLFFSLPTDSCLRLADSTSDIIVSKKKKRVWLHDRSQDVLLSSLFHKLSFRKQQGCIDGTVIDWRVCCIFPQRTVLCGSRGRVRQVWLNRRPQIVLLVSLCRKFVFRKWLRCQ